VFKADSSSSTNPKHKFGDKIITFTFRTNTDVLWPGGIIPPAFGIPRVPFIVYLDFVSFNIDAYNTIMK
jgi:hypothetical protein